MSWNLPANVTVSVNHLLHRCRNTLLDFVYPAHCCACDRRILDGTLSLCRPCSELLEVLDPSDRCSTCFGEVVDVAIPCAACTLRSPFWEGRGAVFSYRDTAAVLIRQMKYGNKPYLSRGAAAYMAVQADRLGWAIPDLIIPVPIPWPRKLERGYNQSSLLASELAKLWGGRAVDALVRDAGEWSQAGLSSQQRRELTAERFRVKRGADLRGKVVCIVDDVTTTGATLEACGEVVSRCDVRSVYAMTLCQAERTH